MAEVAGRGKLLAVEGGVVTDGLVNIGHDATFHRDAPGSGWWECACGHKSRRMTVEQLLRSHSMHIVRALERKAT